jgi:hypothetical protein
MEIARSRRFIDCKDCIRERVSGLEREGRMRHG